MHSSFISLTISLRNESTYVLIELGKLRTSLMRTWLNLMKFEELFNLRTIHFPIYEDLVNNKYPYGLSKNFKSLSLKVLVFYIKLSTTIQLNVHPIGYWCELHIPGHAASASDTWTTRLRIMQIHSAYSNKDCSRAKYFHSEVVWRCLLTWQPHNKCIIVAIEREMARQIQLDMTTIGNVPSQREKSANLRLRCIVFESARARASTSSNVRRRTIATQNRTLFTSC